MSRKIYLIAVLSMAIVSLMAEYSENFPIGDYSEYTDSEILEWLSEAHFNTKRFSADTNTNLNSTFSDYNNYGLDVRIKDYSWDPDNNDYGVYTDFLINNLMRVSIIKPYVFGDYKLAIPTRCIKLLQRKWRSFLKKVTG